MKILLTLSMFLVFNSAIASISTVNSGEPISAIKINQIIDQVNSIPESPTYTYPTITKFTSGSGTYTTPSGVKYIKIKMIGGGGGGGGGHSGGGGTTTGVMGGNSTFGTSLLTAFGGGGGAYAGVGIGGTTTVNNPAISIINVNGGEGTSGGRDSSYVMAGVGGSSFFGGAGGAQLAGNGRSAAPNTGSGGGGGAGSTGATPSVAAGTGGGAGGFIESMIANPSATYSYSVGTGGSGAIGVSSGLSGGNGASGIIIIEEYYQ